MLKKVVIDAGHGGEDPGGVGVGLQEKHINLDVAKRIKSFLEQRYSGIQVIMTRETDTFLTLHQRCEIANQAKADLFISIHTNSRNNTTASGYEDYVDSDLSPTSRTEAIRKTIHSSIVKVLPIRDRGRKIADFYVLKATIMPAVLLEIGFIIGDSNHLKSNEFLANFSLAAANGIAASLNVPSVATSKKDCENGDCC